MYIVRNSEGEIVAIATRKEDAVAMTHTVGKEPPLSIETKKSTA
jgi:hypothetical protein